MRKNNFAFFQNRDCEYFPCHETDDLENFNCLFCYCPLYALGEDCGGNFSYLGDIKDCSKCLVPHSKSGYMYVVRRFDDVAKIAMRKKDDSDK